MPRTAEAIPGQEKVLFETKTMLEWVTSHLGKDPDSGKD